MLVWLVYQPGLSGPFLFDDFPNLKEIGALGPIENWELFRAFLASGFAGPTGRPISLASFLLNANDWPADPEPFKLTNILIHLLIGIVLFPTLRKLLRSIGRSPAAANWTAALASALWLLNPFLVSTTLYVVQRMTQLPALFSILAIWGYLQGRLWLATRPRLGYWTMTMSVVCGTILATFSKENSALLPLLILVLEVTLRGHWSAPGPSRQWKIVFLGLPSLAILVYLAMKLPGLGHPIPTRNFSLLERLLTEARIIWDYLYHLFIPHIQTRGLFQDGIQVSTGLSTPWTTGVAIVGLLLLGIGAWLSRNRWPLLSLGILFFLAGHLLESTTIALELYFEHRNYLPATFLFLPAAAGIISLQTRIRPAVVAFMCIAITGSYAFATWQRAGIWGDEDQLSLVWAETNPESPRAQNGAAQTWLRLGHPERAIAVLERAMANNPDSALLHTSYLAYRANLGSLPAAELSSSLQRIRHQPFDAQMLAALKMLVEVINAKAPAPEHAQVLMSFLESLRNDLKGKVQVAHRYSYYLQGLLLSGQGEGKQALPYFSAALARYKSVETGLQIVSMLATNGQFKEALVLLDQSAQVLKTESDSKIKRRAQYLRTRNRQTAGDTGERPSHSIGSNTRFQSSDIEGCKPAAFPNMMSAVRAGLHPGLSMPCSNACRSGWLMASTASPSAAKSCGRKGYCLLLSAFLFIYLAGCASQPGPLGTQREQAATPRATGQAYWWHVRFRLRWPEGQDPPWYP